MGRSEYFRTVAVATCSRLSAAPPGARNVSLCREAFALGQVAHLAPDGGEQALTELCATACALGLSQREVATTATRAFRRGAGERIELEANSAGKGVFYLNSMPANPEIAARLADDARDERQHQERQRGRARALWDECGPIAGTLAETYLRGRGILRLVPHDHVGFHPSGGTLGAPCCVFRVTDSAGETVAVQRVALLMDGSDRDRERGKRSLGPVGAGWLQFGDADPEKTIVVEGPEDALAIRFACEDITAPRIRVVAMLGQRWAKAAAEFPGAVFVADGNSVEAAREAAVFRCHSFELACADLDIEHRLTKPNHPWTNGQVERMNRTLKEATVRRYHYATHDALRAHLGAFLDAYNFARRLKTLRGLTPFEFISQRWTSEPHRFRVHPDHLIPGPNI